MSSLREKIANDVKEIKEDNKKHFGTKLPGNENKEREQTEQELTYSQMIMGSLASLIWGVQNVKDDAKIKTLLSRKDNIYNIVKSIKETINTAINDERMIINSKLTKETVNKLKIDLANPIISAINNIPDNVSLYKKILEAINRIDETIQGIFISVPTTDLTGILEAINRIDETVKGISISVPTTDLTGILEAVNRIDETIQSISISVPTTDLTNIKESINKIKEAIFDIPESFRLIISDEIISALDLKDDFSLDDRLKVLNDLDSKFKSFDQGQDDIYQSLFVIGDELRNSILSIKSNDYDYTSYLKDIKDRFDILNNSIADLYSDLLIEITKEANKPVTSSSISEDSINRIIDAINTKENKLDLNLTANGNDIEKITQLISELEKFNIDDKKYINCLNGLYELINKLGSKDLKVDVKKVSENLTFLKDEILGPVNSEGKLTKEGGKSLAAIFKSLEVITKDLNISSNVDNLSIILDDIITAISIDKDKINISGLKTLLKVTDVDKGEVKTLIDNLIKISGDAQINEKNIIALGSFFESIAKVGDIGLIKRYKIKSNIKYFSKFITKDIPAIFNELVKVSADSESEDKLKAMAALGDFFLGIVKIAEIDNKQRKQLKNNLRYIKQYILESIAGKNGIINAIIRSINEASQEFGDSIKALNELFDKLFKVADFSFKDLFLLELKLSYLSNIFKEQVTGGNGQFNEALIPTLIHIQGLKFIKERIEVLQDTFGLIEHLFENIPSFKDLLFTSIKLNVINNVDLKLLDLIIQHINTTPDVDVSGFQNKIENIKDDLDKVKELNDFIIGLPILKTLFKLRTIQLEFEKIQAIIDYVNTIELINKEQLELFENNGTFIQTISGILKLDDLLKSFDGEVTIKKLQNIIEVLKYFDTIIALWPTKFNIKGFDKLKTVIDPNIRELIESVNNLNAIDKEVFETINNTIKLCETINKYFPDIVNEDELDEGAINTYVKNISTILTGLKQIIDQHVKTIDVDDKLVSNIENLIKLVKSINKLAVMSITAKISSVGLNALSNAAEKLKGVVDTYKDINEEDLKKALDVNKQFTKLLMVSAAILIAGALVMKKIRIVDLIAFTAALSFFTFTIALSYKIIGKGLTNSIEIADSFIHLVALSSLILVLGSLVTKYIKFEDLFAFTFMLSAFLLAITGIFWLMGKAVGKTIKIAEDVTDLIKVSAAVLLIGGLFMKYIGPEGPMAFAVLLGGFIGFVVGVFTIASRFMKGSLSVAKEFSYLIGISALSLILGALFISKPERAIGALAFAILLGGFIWGIVKIFTSASKEMKLAFATAVSLAVLIGVSSLILMLGGLFMSDINRAIGALAFALLLDGFIYLLLKAFGSNAALRITKAIPTAVALGIVTIISSIALLAGGGLIVAFPNLIWGIPLFGVLLWGFTAMMCKVLRHAAQHSKDILIGAKIMAILGGLVFEMSIAFRLLIQTANMIDDWFALVGTVAIMGVVLLGLYGLAYLIAKSGPEGLAMIGLATAIIAALIGCIALLGIGIQEIAKGMEEMARVSHMDVDFGNLAKLLLGIVALTPALMGLGAMIIPIGLGALSMKALRSFLLDSADVVQAYASLKIPMFDESGKFTGFKIMSEKDIEKSMKNTKLIVTSLFYTIKEIYDKNPDMFKFSLTSLLTGGGGTIFGKVAAAGKGLAVMLSMLAVSVQQWADLKIPIYEGEKIIGYKTIDNDAFIKTGKNIQAVVTCLGQAILDVYNNAPDGMFDYQFGIFGDSPFEKVSKSLLQMGKMLAVVAEGVEHWSDLKIPVYKNNSTEIQGYITIDKDEFVKAAENIKAVVTCLAGAVLDIYDEHPELFEADGWFGLGSSKFSKVSRALGNMGYALGSIAKGVEDWADLKIPVYKTKGTEIDHYLSLTSNDFVKAGENIKEVVKCLSQAIIDVYEENPTMFDDSWFTDSPFSKVIDVIGPMGKALKNIAEAVQDWADLKIPIYKDDSTEIQSYLTLSNDDFDKVGKNIDSVVTCLVSSVASLYDDHEEWFDDSWFSDSKVAKVLNSIGPLGSSLKDIADAVDAWADLKIPIYGQDDKGKAIITGYITMGDDTFTKVTKNIDKVVTSLIRSVASLYDKHEDWFDGTGIFGLGDSPIGKVLGSIAPLGNTLKDIADAVEAWAELKIPIYGSDEKGNAIITGYKTLASSDFDNAAKNINTVVTSLVRSVAALYYDPQAKAEGWFDGGFFLGKSPVSKVLTSIEPLGNILGGIADAIVAFAEFKIPIYTHGPNGEAIISGYKTLSDGDIDKAGEKIGDIVTALVKAIGNIYFDPEAQAQKWFDTEHWYESKTPFSKVLTAMEPLGNTIASIAEGVKNFAELKVPIYGKNKKGELVITNYKTLADADFDTATKNIGIIITTLGNAIGEVVKNNPGIFDKENSPVAKAAEAIKLTGDTLNGVASVIAYYATGQFPVLKYDKNGKLIPGATLTVGLNQIEAMKKRVNAIITALGDAIIEVYKDPANKQIWDQWEGNGFKQDAPAMIVANSIKALSESLNGTIDLISKIIELDFNTIANNMNSDKGLVTSFKNVIDSITKIFLTFTEEKTIDNTTITGGFGQWSFDNKTQLNNGSSSIKSLSDNIVKVFESIKAINDSYNTNKKSIDALIKSSIDADLGNIIDNTIYNIIQKLVYLNSLNNYVEQIKDSKKITNKIESSLKDIFNSIVKINEIYSDKNVKDALESLCGSKSKFKEHLSKIINNGEDAGIINYLVSNINININFDDVKKNTLKSKQIISKITDSIQDLFKEISRLYKTYNKYEKDIASILIENTDKTNYIFNENVDRILKLIESISKTIISSSTDDIDNFKTKIKNNKEYIDEIDDLLNEITLLSSKNSLLKDISFTNIENAVNNFIKCIDNIKATLNGTNEETENIKDLINTSSNTAIRNNVKDFEKIIEQAKTLFNLTNELANIANVAKDIDGNTYKIISTGVSTINESLSAIKIENQEDINNFISDLENYIGKIKLIYNSIEFTEKVNSLKDGILSIYTITKEIENNNIFNQHTDILKKYIEIINSVELNKLSMMKGFVDAMNQLSMRLGSLDNLTDAIANKLSAVLYELVNQLTKADASINNAHQLQEKRKKLIEESVNKIETLMSQHMIVEISQKVEENINSDITPEGMINNTPVGAGEGQGIDFKESDNTKKLESPENKKATAIPGSTNNSNGLTRAEFESLMQNNYINAIAKAVKKYQTE